MTQLFRYSLIALIIVSCSPEEQQPEGYTTTGEASFYGRSFDGQQTASGDTYKMDSLTAAHLYLPLGTKLEVENLANGLTVQVIVNDRGPYAGNRLLDLSRAAADSLGMIENGTAEVRITVVEAAEGYTVTDSVAEDRMDEFRKAM